MTLRWGILSAGKISNDFVTGLSTLCEDEHSIVAVAARDKSRAEEFAKKFKIPKSYDSYEDLAKDPDVDIVYIGTLNPQHFDTGMLMLENNKHILCEKPLCMNEKQCRKLITYAERKKLFLMEGIWSRFFPAYQYLKKQISTGVLGTIKKVEVSLGFDLNNVDRLQKQDMGGGTILDLGVYCIQISQWAFEEPPLSITAEAELNSESIDIAVKGELHYSGGGIAHFRTSAKAELENCAIITGTKAQIKIKNFWCPTTIIDIDGNEKTWLLPEANFETNFHNSVGLRYEAEEARQCILAEKLQSASMTHNDSILFAKIEDEIRKKIGVVYKEDLLNKKS